MLRAFPEAYQTLVGGETGPQIPGSSDDDFEDKRSNAIKAVLSDGHNADVTYADVEPWTFFWYRYLFIGRGKPATHTLALLQIEDEDLAEEAPEPLKSIVERIKVAIANDDADGGIAPE